MAYVLDADDFDFVLVGVCITTPAAVDLPIPRTTQIQPLEMLAAQVPWDAHPEHFFQRRVIHFVDNQGAISNFVRGGGEEDCSAISAKLQLQAATLAASPWFEYVESAANVADEPSRHGRLTPAAEKCFAKPVRLVSFSPAPWAQAFAKSSLRDRLAHWPPVAVRPTAEPSDR